MTPINKVKRSAPLQTDHPDYLEWIYKESDMPVAVRSVAGDLWKRVR